MYAHEIFTVADNRLPLHEKVIQEVLPEILQEFHPKVLQTVLQKIPQNMPRPPSGARCSLSSDRGRTPLPITLPLRIPTTLPTGRELLL